MTQRVDALVLGAGAVGVSAALHLNARGRSVALVDRLPEVAGETSYGNTGIIESEAMFPYAFPRSLPEIVVAALNRDPRAEIRYGALAAVAPAIFRYFLMSAPAPRFASGLAMRTLTAVCVREHLAFAEPAQARPLLREGGWIKVFRTERGRDAGLKDAEEVAPYGVTSEPLSRDKLIALEPHIGEAAIGGLRYSNPLTTPDPQALIAAYAKLFVARGGRIALGRRALARGVERRLGRFDRRRAYRSAATSCLRSAPGPTRLRAA